MASPHDGYIEIKFNKDKSQALASIYPPYEKGVAITLDSCLHKLRIMGIGFGLCEGALADAVQQVGATRKPVVEFVIAQGVVPQNGEDAQIRYRLPRDLVSMPLPRNVDDPTMIDWFSLDPRKMVRANSEIATLVPATLGSHGKTVTWPIQVIHAQPGRNAGLFAGTGIRSSDDGLRLYAIYDGYLSQQGEQLTVLPIQCYENPISQQEINRPGGIVSLQEVVHSQLKANGIIAVKGISIFSRLRAKGDIFIQQAQNCQIIASGNVYVLGGLRECEVIAGQKIIASKNAVLQGGHLSGTLGIEAESLGDAMQSPMEIYIGTDQYLQIRNIEIEEEITEAEASIARIRQAIKPFQTISANATMTEDRRAILTQLQKQQRSHQQHVTTLHSERRQLQFALKQKIAGTLSVSENLYPNVWITLGKGRGRIERPMKNVRLAGDSASTHQHVETQLAAA